MLLPAARKCTLAGTNTGRLPCGRGSYYARKRAWRVPAGSCPVARDTARGHQTPPSMAPTSPPVTHGIPATRRGKVNGAALFVRKQHPRAPLCGVRNWPFPTREHWQRAKQSYIFVVSPAIVFSPRLANTTTPEDTYTSVFLRSLLAESKEGARSPRQPSYCGLLIPLDRCHL